MTEPPPEAWWVRDRVAPQPPPAAAVAVTTRLPEPPPSLRLVPAPAAARDRRSWSALVLAGIGVLAVGATGWGLYAARTTGGAGARQTPPAAVAPVDPASVQVSASSTQRPDGTVSYDPANTLDGDPSTAWNSDGEGGDRWLSYRFAAPVDLRSVSVLNGYQKVRKRPGRPALDLYPVNERVRRVRLVTDTGTWLWELADRREPQTFTALSGSTRTLRLEVLSAYASTDYPDLAVSEVSFSASDPARSAPAAG